MPSTNRYCNLCNKVFFKDFDQERTRADNEYTAQICSCDKPSFAKEDEQMEENKEYCYTFLQEEIHYTTVTVIARSEEEAKQKFSNNQGEFQHSQFDHFGESKIVEVEAIE